MRKKWARRTEDGEIVPGVKPEAFATIKWAVTLPKADIPVNLSRVLASGDEKTVVDHLKRHFLPANLEEATYGKHFRVLLHTEEYRSE